MTRTEAIADQWSLGEAYELYMGRWSRPMAREFVGWLRPKAGGHWLEIGCGSGALTSCILERCDPATLVACDQSAPFAEHAQTMLSDSRVSFVTATTQALPIREGGFDAVVSGLVLNFIPEPVSALAAMRERVREGGVVAAYVWDYAGGVEFLQHFWAEAVALDENATALDEARRFAAWQPAQLRSWFESAGLSDVESTVLGISTTFANFDDYWSPFLGKVGPAPSYVTSLSDAQRDALSARLRARLPRSADGTIRVAARAFALRSRR